MKNKLTKAFKTFIILFGLSLLLWDCEKETVLVEETTVQEHQVPKLSIKPISKEKIEKNVLLSSKLESFESKLYASNDNLSSKGGTKYVKDFDFILDLESGIYIEEGDYHSYTFPILESRNQNIRNVLFSLNEDNGYDSYLVVYGYTYDQLDSLDATQLSSKTKVYPIKLDFNSLTSRMQAYYFCSYEYVLVDTGDLYGAGNEKYRWVLKSSECTTIWGTETYGDEYYTNTTNTNTDSEAPLYSGSGGLLTSPTLSEIYDEEELIMFGMLKSTLGLNLREYSWITSNYYTYTVAKEIFDFLGQNLVSEEAITEAKMWVTLEMLDQSNTITLTWKPNAGTFKNREALKYTHTAEYNGMLFFNLENRQILISSGQSELKITKDVAWTSEVNPDGFHYIYSRETKRLYQYKIPPANYPNADIDFLLDAFWSGVKTTARYATPLEDAIILIDGKDFDGVEQSKVQTAGFMIVGVIPGGKILKPISKVVKNSDVAATGWKVITKIGDDTVALSFKVVNGIVDFGSRSKLASVIKTTSLEEAHHIIPWNKLDNEVIQEAAYAGFHMNAEINGKALQKYTALTGEGLHGNHPAYDDVVEHFTQKFKDEFSGFSPEQAKDFLENNLIPKLDVYIESAKGSSLNLNEYFKQIVKPSLGL